MDTEQYLYFESDEFNSNTLLPENLYNLFKLREILKYSFIREPL